MSHHVLISLASNRFQKKNLSKARCCLEEILYDCTYTSELWTEPIGSSVRGEQYLNQLVAATTMLDEPALTERLKQIELAFGRNAQKRALGIVPVDLDILSYDGRRQHQRDWQRPYVQLLLPELPEIV